MAQKSFEAKVIEAEKRVAHMDTLDGGKDRALRTIFLALECGLHRPETGADYDAYVMLKEVIAKPNGSSAV